MDFLSWHSSPRQALVLWCQRKGCERVCVCVCVRERECSASVCVCLCVRERDRERLRETKWECLCGVCVCVCVSERERCNQWLRRKKALKFCIKISFHRLTWLQILIRKSYFRTLFQLLSWSTNPQDFSIYFTRKLTELSFEVQRGSTKSKAEIWTERLLNDKLNFFIL